MSEFNVISDVEAASLTFAGWDPKDDVTFNVISDVISDIISDGSAAPPALPLRPIQVVSWDLCVQDPLPWPLYDELIGNNNTGVVANFLSRICKHVYSDNKHDANRSDAGAVICDALAVAIAIDPSVIAASAMVHVEVETEGTCTRGMTVVDWGCYDGVQRNKNVQWVTRADLGKYVDLLRATVASSESTQVVQGATSI